MGVKLYYIYMVVESLHGYLVMYVLMMCLH